MPQYRKKPVVIEAFCLGIDDMPDWFCTKRSRGEIVTHGTYDTLMSCDIVTLEGTMHAERGEWIIQGVEGEVYPCKSSIFMETYEPVAVEMPKSAV